MKKLQKTKPTDFEAVIKRQIKKLVVKPLKALITNQTLPILKFNQRISKKFQHAEDLIEILARQKYRDLEKAKKISG